MIIVSNRLVILRVLQLNKGGFTVRSIRDRSKAYGFEVSDSSAYSAVRSFVADGYAIQIGEGLNETGFSAKIWCLTTLGRKYLNAAIKKIDKFSAWDAPMPTKATAVIEKKDKANVEKVS